MKVYITEFNVDMEVKTSGMQLDVYDPSGDERLGDLTVTKTKLVWCSGKQHKKNGKEVTWAAFIAWMDGQ